MNRKSNIVGGLLRKLAQFGIDRRGQVALSFGLAAIPLMGVGGIALDYNRKLVAESTTQGAIDGAAFAAAAALNAGKTQPEYEAAAQQFFDFNKPQNLIGSPEVAIEVNWTAGTLTASTDAAIPTTLSKVIGWDKIAKKFIGHDIMVLRNAHDGSGSGGSGGGGSTGGGGLPTGSGGAFGATISLPSFTPEHRGEIVMVMDYSGSMDWYLGGEKKYITMRNSAAELINALSSAKTNQYVQFGIVPFSSEVYTTMPKKYWHGYTGEGNRSSCTRDRQYPYNLSDATPTNPGQKAHKTRFGKVSKEWEWFFINGQWKQKKVPTNNPNSSYFYEGENYNYRNDCGAYSGSRKLVIQDLTGNHQDTYDKILDMKPYYKTHIAVGMEFGYHLLSPNAPFTSGVAYNDPETEKAVILLTDGAQTSRAFGSGGNTDYEVSNGESNLASLCTNMKADGIRIITVSYDLYDEDTENRLKNCATSIDDFYDADTKAELETAFQGITAKLAKDMFLAK